MNFGLSRSIHTLCPAMHPTSIEILASVLFALAILHTFCVKRFAHWAHQHPKGSIMENALHFLAETEIVFGLWAAALFVGVTAFTGSVHKAVDSVRSWRRRGKSLASMASRNCGWMRQQSLRLSLLRWVSGASGLRSAMRWL